MAAIYHAEIPVDLAGASRERPLPVQFFRGDNDSHIFTAWVGDSANPEAGLLAGTVAGTALRGDGVTVTLSGEKGSATVPVTFNGITVQATPCRVTLPQAAFRIPGMIKVSIVLTDGETTTTVLSLSGSVVQSNTDAVTDPEELIPNLPALQTAAAQAIAAAEDAETAAESVPALVAPTFNTTTAYAAGDYVYYNGSIWRFTAAHAAGAWTGSDAVQTTVTDEYSDLKSATSANIYDSMAPYKGVNLFNWADAGNTWGQYREANGTLKTGQSTNYGTSHLIYVKPNTLYKFVSASSFGSTNRVALGIYNIDKGYVRTISATLVTDTNFATFSVDTYCYVQFNIHTSMYQRRTMFCEASLYPDLYVEPVTALQPGKYLDLSGGVDIDDLKFAFHKRTKNLFNKDGEIIANMYFDSGLVGTLTANTNVSSQYIPFQGAGTYHLLFPKSIYGTNCKICAFGEGKNYIGRFPGTLITSDNNAKAKFEATSSNLEGNTTSAGFDDIRWFGYTFSNSVASSAMFVKDTGYPEEYIAYEDIISLDGVTSKRDNAEYLVHETSVNLFNRWGEVTLGKRFNTTSSSAAFENDSSCDSQFVPFEGAGTYWMWFPFSKYGASAKVLLLDQHKNKLRMVSVTKQDTSAGNIDQPGYITVSDADALDVAYMGYTFYKHSYGKGLIVKGNAYPSAYVPYRNTWDFNGVNMNVDAPNTLYRKTVLFDGDSICQYSTDESGYGAYARRIANNNEMIEYNYAVGGGTITAGMYTSGGAARHWVSTSVDTMYAEHPSADYVILEGGTNDADLIGSILGGSLPEKFGAVTDATDFSGEYDDETFCGAVETLFYKAINYWPKAKIGFIVAMRMGMSTNYDNRRAYFGKIMEICAKWGIPCLNLWDECHMNPRMETYYDANMTSAENIAAHKFYMDGQHPTPDGYEYITPIIEAWMRTL